MTKFILIGIISVMLLFAALHYVAGLNMLWGKRFIWWKIDAIFLLPLGVVYYNYLTLSRSYLKVEAKKIRVYAWHIEIDLFDIREMSAMNRSRTLRRFATSSISIELEFKNGDRYCVSPIDETGFINYILKINPAIENNVH